MMSAVVVDTDAPSRVRRAEFLLRARELGIALAIVIVFVVTTLKNHSFAGSDSLQQLLNGAALIALLGVGETLVIVTRNVDLSVGSNLGISAYLVGLLYVDHPHTPAIVAMGAGVVIGAVLGAINGLIITVLRVPSLVVTLAALYIVRGVDAMIVNGKQIDPTSIPRSFQAIGFKNLFGVPWLAIVVVVIIGIATYCMRTFRSGRDLYAIGSNPDAAALAGVPAGRRIFAAFTISGALAGLGGAFFLAEFATVNSTAGSGYELLVVAAVVVGGVAIAGGSGTVLGAALGALLLNTINQALVATRVSSFWNGAIAGALLLAAIAFDRWLSRRVARLESTRGARRVI